MTRNMAGVSAGLALTGVMITVPTKAQVLPDEPINTWVLKSKTPNHVYENDLAYDPTTGQIVYHGGHVGQLYPQSNYTFLYNVRQNRWRESQSPYRPQRRCYNDMTYLESARMCLTGHGSRGHGSLPQGGFSAKQGDYKECYRELNVGPWLYDAVADIWMDSRTLVPKWANKDLANISYERNSDVAFYFYHDMWVYYCPRSNRITVRYAPDEIMTRSGYAVATDPVRRKIVFFGGYFYGPVKDPSERYKSDTWIYDIATDIWRQAHPKNSPSSGIQRQYNIGLEMVYHNPSSTMLMLINPVSGVPPKVEATPPAELWSFDLVTEEWMMVPVTGDGPTTGGIAVYASQEDLLVVLGGGKDAGERDHGREVRTCRINLPNKQPTLPATVDSVQITTDYDQVTLRWTPADKDVYDIFRAKCEGLSGLTTSLYSIKAPVVSEWLADAAARKAAKNQPDAPKPVKRDMWGPDADPIPGVYEKIGRTKAPFHGQFIDKTITPGAVYAYQIIPADAPPNQLRSLPVFNQPWHPTHLCASVEHARKVILRWDANKENDLTGYKVYRAIGAEIETATGKLLTPQPIKATELSITDDDLSNGVVRAYWVTAINKGGIESGAAPLAYSFPDAPASLTVVNGEGPSNLDGLLLGYRIGWEWPANIRIAGFNVYYANHHRNGFNGPGGTYDADWKKLTPKPITDTEFIFHLDRDDPHMHSYFHVRTVNVLGQEGFYTDIISPTDARFRPAP